MNLVYFVVLATVYIGFTQAFAYTPNKGSIFGPVSLLKTFHSKFGPHTALLMACRRNNKEEKRKRNKAYARKFQSKTGDSRKKVVVEMKRGIVAASEARFQSQVFQLTTDDDMPAYSGFEFAA